MSFEQVVEVMKELEKKKEEGTLDEKGQKDYIAIKAYHMSLVKSHSFNKNNISMPPVGQRE